MARERSKDDSSHRVPIVVAAIGAVAVVVAALISTLGGNSGGGGGDGRGESSTTSTTTADVQLVSWGSADVEPAPSVRFTFDGAASGLQRDQRVFVLGRFSGAPSQSASPTTGPSDPPPYAISPPATHFPDGTWHVEWTLDSRPAVTSFIAVATKVWQVAPGACETPPCSGGGDVVLLNRADLQRLGPAAETVVATAEVPVAPSPSP